MKGARIPLCAMVGILGCGAPGAIDAQDAQSSARDTATGAHAAPMHGEHGSMPAGDEWRLGEPDLVVEPREPYVLQPNGGESFRNLVLPVSISRPRWVRAVELRPGAPGIVHHAVIMVDRTGAARRLARADSAPGFDGMFHPVGAEHPDGFFLGWTPGKLPLEGKEGLAWRLEPGTDLVLQVHIRPPRGPDAEPVSIRPRIGLHFADGPPSRTPAVLTLGTHEIDIPAGASAYVARDEYALPVDVRVLSLYPHAHYLAERMEVFATLPDGTSERLLHIEDWDFDRQREYRLPEPVPLPRGAVLTMRYTYDNSSANPRNPNDPPERVTYGPHSDDAMADLIVQVMTRDSASRTTLVRDFALQRLEMQMAGFRQMIRLEQRPGFAHYNLAVALEALGRTEGAIRHYGEAVRLRPEDARAHNNLGRALQRAGRVDDAIAQYRRALELCPGFAFAHYNMGIALQTRGELDEAAGHLRRAIRAPVGLTGKNLAAAHAGLARILAAQGKLGEAIEHYEQALELGPEDADTHHDLGLALARANRMEAAVERFREAVRIRPDFAEAHGNLGNALRLIGRPEAAIGHYRRALKAAPDDADYHYNLALALLATGRAGGPGARGKGDVSSSEAYEAHAEEALSHLDRAAGLEPGWPAPVIRKAWILATSPAKALRDPEAAIRSAERAVRMTDRAHPVALEAMAAAYAAAGRFEEAVPAAREALAIVTEAGGRAGAAELAARIEKEIRSYEAREPVREASLD